MGRIMSIDLGVTGAWAIVNSEGVLVEVDDLPVIDKAISPPLLSGILNDYIFDIDAVVVELVHAMPVTGSKGNFSLGRSLGIVEGVVGALSVPLVRLRPAEWKRAVKLPPGGDRKELARAEAIRRWPDDAPMFARKKDHNRADAALIGAGYWKVNS